MDIDEFIAKNRNARWAFTPIPKEHTNVYSQANWIINDSHAPYVPLDIDGPWVEMLAEAQGLEDEFVVHRGDGGGWSSLCVHGVSAKRTMTADSYPELNDVAVKYTWTEIADRCPVTVDYFKNKFPWNNYQRLRYMRLAPGGYIPPHNDGPRNTLAVVNISLNNPLGCEMVLENVGVVPFKDTGGAMAFNTTHNHVVKNSSNIPRYHMIVHGMWKSQYNELIVRSYNRLLSLL